MLCFLENYTPAKAKISKHGERMAKVKVLLDTDNCFDSDDDDSHIDDVSHASSDKDDHVVDDDSNAGDDDSNVADDDDSNVDDEDEDDSHVDVDDDDDIPTLPTEVPTDSGPDIADEATETAPKQDNEKSGMAGVIARILSKDISKSKRVLLAKGKTSQEIFRDISQRKRQREESENPNVKSKHPKEEKLHDVPKEEKRKLWESMGRRIPSILDNPREVRLRKIATQGMVQLFRLVSQAKMQG